MNIEKLCVLTNDKERISIDIRVADFCKTLSRLLEGIFLKNPDFFKKFPFRFTSYWRNPFEYRCENLENHRKSLGKPQLPGYKGDPEAASNE